MIRKTFLHRLAAALVVDQHNRAVVDLNHVESRDKAEVIRWSRYRAGMNTFVPTGRLGIWQTVGAAIDAAVNSASFGRVGPLALDPFGIGQTRAVPKLVDYACRDVWLVISARRRRVWFGLQVHWCGNES